MHKTILVALLATMVGASALAFAPTADAAPTCKMCPITGKPLC